MPDRSLRPLVITGAVALVAFVIWNASRHGLCAPHSLVQGHAGWHLLGAVSAYLLFRLSASERSGYSSMV